MHANTNGRLYKGLTTSTLAIAPVTRAIRTALSISATLLALGGSGAAIAQDTGACTTTSNTATCEGSFTATLPGTFAVPADDLTLVLGDSAHSVPTNVTPASGAMGVNANWKGNVGITSFADISTVDATGLSAYGSTSASINNAGSITTNVAAADAKAMDVNSYGDVTVVNSGAVSAHSTGVYDVTAVNAYSSNGTLSFTNTAAGTIMATAQDGNAIALEASSATSSANVLNYGAITAESGNGLAIGLLTQSGDFSIDVNGGSIEANSSTSQALGMLASSTGFVIVHNDGSITATSGGDQAIGLETYGAEGSYVYNTGSVTAASTDGPATGIMSPTINTSGSIKATSSNGQAIGALASSTYAKVINSGTIAATGNETASAIGIAAYSQYGSSVINSGAVTASTTSTTDAAPPPASWRRRTTLPLVSATPALPIAVALRRFPTPRPPR